MSDDTPGAATHHDEALLQHLRELARERDPVPAHVTAAARSALATHRRARSKRADAHPAHADEPA